MNSRWVGMGLYRIVYFYLIYASSTAFGLTQEECTPVHLGRPGESMEALPVQNQNYFGTCAVVSVADMVDAWRYSRRTEEQSKEPFDFTAVPDLAIGSKVFLYQNQPWLTWLA